MIENLDFVIRNISAHKGEFAVVKNPSYIYPPFDYYPLAAPNKNPEMLKAVLMDMDGTTTSTEVICIYALETMVRRMADCMDKEQWEGVDHVKDLPFIIGNSTTKHVEYLLHTYKHLIKAEPVFHSFLEAAWWTMKFGQDAKRKEEVIQNLKKEQLDGLIESIMASESPEQLIALAGNKPETFSFTTLVSLGIDIYYETYHRMLALLKEGRAAEVKSKVLGSSHSEENIISPMPGIPVLIPMLKGWLGADAGLFTDYLVGEWEQAAEEPMDTMMMNQVEASLIALGVHFEQNPVKLGLVTSSIFYEADIVIREVLTVMSGIIASCKLPDSKKKKILAAYKDYHRVYDAFVTASDSNEIRLKPHRDLYSIALHQVGLHPADFDKVAAFEDSQSGTIAIRAAGIGCCIAVPFAQTKNHNFEAATHQLQAGVPQAMLEHFMFLKNFSI